MILELDENGINRCDFEGMSAINTGCPSPYFDNMDFDENNPYLSCIKLLSNFINHTNMGSYTWEGKWVVGGIEQKNSGKELRCTMYGKHVSINYYNYIDYDGFDCAFYSWTPQTKPRILGEPCDGQDSNANYKWKNIHNQLICKRIGCKNGYNIDYTYYTGDDFSHCKQVSN